MKKLIPRIYKRIKLILFGDPQMKAQLYEGLYLPGFRENQGLSEDDKYLESIKEQLDHLSDNFNFKSNTVILDFGCGQGRLANGLQAQNRPFKSYYGIDTHKKSVDWCNKWLTKYNSKFNFIHVPASNARYNRQADSLKSLPFGKNTFDLIFLNSVFSHMLTDDVIFYLNEFNRTIKDNGVLYITAFVEENVPEVQENPENYIGSNKGSLHRVRFEKKFFLSLFEKTGFSIELFAHQHIKRTRQSVIIARKSST